MKFLLLPVLCWTLAISQIFAQKQLPASIQSYAVNWSYAVKDMLNASGYEVPGPKSNFDFDLNLESRSEELQLDSIISFYGYGINLNDSTPLLRNTYTYPEPNVQVVVEYFFDQDHWTALRRSTLKSDNLGRMEETIAEAYDAEAGIYVPESRIRLFPRENSLELVDSLFIYEWSASEKNWDRQLAVWNQHDELNQLTESRSSIEVFEMPFVFIDRYSYSPLGDLWEIHSFIVDGGIEISSGKKEFQYQDRLLIYATTYVDNGTEGFIAQSQIEYIYHDFGQVHLVLFNVYDFDKQEWTTTQIDGYVYDSEERVITKEENLFTPDGFGDRHKTQFSYVTDEYIASEAEYFYDTNTESWLLENRKFFYYNQLSAVEPELPAKADALFLYPNPSSGVVQIKLVGNVSIYVYSLSGQLVQQFRMAPSEKMLDLSHLPAGMYQVMAKSNEDYFSGKLILQ
jgi:hypothetical protein